MRFSIITICYNAEKEIHRTIQSVLIQDFSDMEYLVIDGGSKDKTNEIIESYRQQFEKKNIEFVHISEVDQGISDAFNKGIKLAKGEIIATINAGDQLNKKTLIKVDRLFDEKTDILYGNLLWVDSYNGMQYIRKAKKNLATINLESCVLHPASFIRRNAYDKVGLYNITYKICMDRDLFSRMKKAGMRFKYIDEVLSIMDSGGVSDQGTRQKDKFYEGKRIATARGVSSIVYYIFYFIRWCELSFLKYLKKNKKLYLTLKRLK